MRGQVAVSKIEPIRAAVNRQTVQCMESLSSKAPPLCGIHNPRKRVRHDVQIWRDFQSMQNDIVPGVDDDRQLRRVHHLVEAQQQLRRANSASKRGYLAAFESFERSHESP